jgi:hypothetical protein
MTFASPDAPAPFRATTVQPRRAISAAAAPAISSMPLASTIAQIGRLPPPRAGAEERPPSPCLPAAQRSAARISSSRAGPPPVEILRSRSPRCAAPRGNAPMRHLMMAEGSRPNSRATAAVSPSAPNSSSSLSLFAGRRGPKLVSRPGCRGRLMASCHVLVVVRCPVRTPQAPIAPVRQRALAGAPLGEPVLAQAGEQGAGCALISTIAAARFARQQGRVMPLCSRWGHARARRADRAMAARMSRTAVNCRLRSPFARGGGGLLLPQVFKGAILASKLTRGDHLRMGQVK